ncbi:hypothetical protein C8J56DRAFT_1134585 [Mycena floridula]|nr:hypothetical protein C8J56DRAFT_1134585 [Mycena floridula]
MDERALTVVKDLLLVIFVHGFKGTDETFLQFPQRLRHVLSESIPNSVVECLVFPAYETKGDLNEAVVRFADWLTTLTVEKEVAFGGAGKASIVLCSHSMGGLLAADTLREFVSSRPDSTAPLWPKIIALVSFDTPYLGLHPFVFKNGVSKAAQYADTARTVGTALFGSKSPPPANKEASTSSTSTSPSPSPAPASSWSKWVPAAYAVGGAIIAGAAAGGAYYKREDLGEGYSYLTDHILYIRNLWNEAALDKRIADLMDFGEKLGVAFTVFYTQLPSAPPTHPFPRTFVVLPKRNAPAFAHFVPAINTIAADEIEAHTGMFAGRTNDGYFELGLQTAKIIRESWMLSRGVLPEKP